jgi:hypothetical protein
MNGKDVIFGAMPHRNPNECCTSAVGDLLVFEQNKDPAAPANFQRWWFDPDDPSPYLFHVPGQPMTAICQKDAKRDLEEALKAVGAPPNLEIVIPSVEKWLIDIGVNRQLLGCRTLAPMLPPLPPPVIRMLERKDGQYTMDALIKDCLRDSAWKMERFGERWPLASIEAFQSRQLEKFMHSSIRRINSLEGCAACGKQKNDEASLLKCARCRITLYCGPKCQKEHWKYHKPHCKRILPCKQGK